MPAKAGIHVVFNKFKTEGQAPQRATNSVTIRGTLGPVAHQGIPTYVISMIKTTAKLTSRGNALVVTIPKDVLDATGLGQGDELSLTARDDGVIEIRHAAPSESALNDAFEWSLGRYPRTYSDLAK